MAGRALGASVTAGAHVCLVEVVQLAAAGARIVCPRTVKFDPVLAGRGINRTLFTAVVARKLAVCVIDAARRGTHAHRIGAQPPVHSARVENEVPSLKGTSIS